MSAQFSQTQIKLEGVDPSENVTEIQSYLEGFQKEIEGADGTVQQITGSGCLMIYISYLKFFFCSYTRG